MSRPSLRTIDISSPVLQKASNVSLTGHLSNPVSVVCPNQEQYQEKQLDQRQDQQSQNEQKAIDKFQTKYASPDNMLAQNINSQHSTPNHTNGSVSAFSDTSSDISDATSSAPSKSGHPLLTIPIVEGITDHDVQQVDMFYRSQKTDVRVCRSLVNMYVSNAKKKNKIVDVQDSTSNSGTPDPTEINMSDWEFARTGIPLLLLNTGEHLRDRKLNILLAEKGTGFTLWEDVLNHMTRYRTPHTNFHTLTLSTDSTRLIGFSFDEANAATEFAESVRALTSDPDDDALNLSKKKNKKKEKKTKQKYKPPKKIDISQPCCFVHVTKLERPQTISILPESFPPPPSGAELAQMALSVTRSRSESSELSECSTTPSDH